MYDATATRSVKEDCRPMGSEGIINEICRCKRQIVKANVGRRVRQEAVGPVESSASIRQAPPGQAGPIAPVLKTPPDE
jgi:hypothetical protein